jgi:hypothetical protein
LDLTAEELARRRKVEQEQHNFVEHLYRAIRCNLFCSFVDKKGFPLLSLLGSAVTLFSSFTEA